jgi:hypothetical protein
LCYAGSHGSSGGFCATVGTSSSYTGQAECVTRCGCEPVPRPVLPQPNPFAKHPGGAPSGRGVGLREIDKAKGREYAATTLKLTTCDGPPYHYKVAYEEAVAMLESLKVYG